MAAKKRRSVVRSHGPTDRYFIGPFPPGQGGYWGVWKGRADEEYTRGRVDKIFSSKHLAERYAQRYL